MDYKVPPPMTKEEIYEFIKEMKIARLRTLNKNGTIHSVPVWYYLEDENVIIFTPENCQKARNVGRNDNITVMIDNQKESTKGVIVYGKVNIGFEASEEESLTLFRRYMDEEKAHQFWKGAKSLAKWIKITVKPTKFASFDYHKDQVYRKAMHGE